MRTVFIAGGGQQPVWRLDAGDSASYSSGQTWANLITQPAYTDAAQTDYDFYLGSGSGADAADPTHNGTPGGKSADEYWSTGNDDYFTIAAGNDGFIDSLHKANAKFTMIFVVKSGANVASTGTFFGTAGVSGGVQIDANDIGVLLHSPSGSGRLRFEVANGTGTRALLSTSPSNVALTNNTLAFVGISVDEAAGKLRWYENGDYHEADIDYSSPSASAATESAKILNSGADNLIMDPITVSRLYQSASFTRAFVQSDFDSFYNQYIGRYT